MLPDYPVIKERLQEKLTEHIRVTALRAQGFMGKIPRVRIFEGHKSILMRDDGSVEESPFHEISAELVVPKESLKAISPEAVKEKLDAVAEELAQKQSKMAFEKLNNVLSEAGNVIDGGGKKFSVDHFLAMIEKVQMDFDDDGNPQLPTLVANPDALANIQPEMQRLETDPEVKAKFATLIEKKREEWRVRESNRKLVG